ncbi:energy transducer TonB [Caballeronia sordidicola]|uniref:energy transducer TonB n=1 Tax=Caballeronia sordidicola TaxID=196367 RepID=UPI00211AEFEF|nr:energy transducer TonB [Caballeronia sordidicola]
MRRIGLMLDAPGIRLACALSIGAITWFFFLAQMIARLSSIPTSDSVATLPLEMRAVIIDPPPVKPPEALQARLTAAPSAPSAPSDKPSLKPRTLPKTKHAAASPIQAEHKVSAPSNAPALPPKESAPSIAPQTNDLTSKHEGPPALTPAVTPALGSTARALTQPLPVVPDDLRETAYRAEALARFSVHVDGSVDVELLKPTSYPRLNQLLLEALRKWRFFPAMEGGHPVESRQDIRVHFNVD